MHMVMEPRKGKQKAAIFSKHSLPMTRRWPTALHHQCVLCSINLSHCSRLLNAPRDRSLPRTSSSSQNVSCVWMPGKQLLSCAFKPEPYSPCLLLQHIL